MQIDLTFDQDPNSLPPGFVMDVEYVASLFDTLFSNNVTINMDIGFGEVRGVPVDPDYIGEPDPSQYYTENYAAVREALVAQGAPGSSTLPLSSPLPGSLRLSQAQAKALGFATDGGVDGYVGIGANTDWSYAIPGQPGTGTITQPQYDCVALLEHELSEAMGRRSDIGGELNYANGQIYYGVGEPYYYAPMDLYRFRAPGVIDTQQGEGDFPAYFSLDEGRSQLGIFNSQDDIVDYGDWYPNGPTSNGDDAFNGFPKTGVVLPLSETDLRLMEAIGWTSDSTGANIDVDTSADLAVLTAAQIAALASEGVTELSASDSSIRYTSSQSAAIHAAGLTVNAPANDLASESFANGSSLVWHFNADDVISHLRTTDVDGSVERDRENIQGASYTAFQKDFTGAGALAVQSFDLDDGAGKVKIFGSGLKISEPLGQIGPSADPGDFTYTSHANETYRFLNGAANDVVTFGSDFGSARIVGIGAPGASGDVLNLSGLFANFAAAQNAMAETGANTLITDARGDTLRLIGVAPGSLTAGQLGFA